jgi:hypothetical protein
MSVGWKLSPPPMCGLWCCAEIASTRHREQTTEKIKALALNGLTMNGRKIIHALANVQMDGIHTSRSLTSFVRMERGRKADAERTDLP